MFLIPVIQKLFLEMNRHILLKSLEDLWALFYVKSHFCPQNCPCLPFRDLLQCKSSQGMCIQRFEATRPVAGQSWHPKCFRPCQDHQAKFKCQQIYYSAYHIYHISQNNYAEGNMNKPLNSNKNGTELLTTISGLLPISL